MMHLTLGLALLIFTTQTLAGGWVSGGGEMLTDKANPWFLENTEQVKYCVQIDESNFGTDIEATRRKVSLALQYWKTEFATAQKGRDFELATQEFLEVECGPDVAVTFQMGVLTDEQVTQVKHPQKIDATAIRTAYDTVNMRGKGFVYVSPEKGPLALTASGRDELIENRWTLADGKLLELILIHELGHVFGIEHTNKTFMDALWPAFAVTSPYLKGALKSDSKNPPFFFAHTSLLENSGFLDGLVYRASDLQAGAFDLLGLPQRHWLEIRTKDAGETIEAYGVRKESEVLLGKFVDKKISFEMGSYGTIYFPPEQKALPFHVPPEGSVYEIKGRTALTVIAWFETASGEKRGQIVIEAAGSDADLSGVHKDYTFEKNFAYMDNWFWSL